MSDHVVNVVKTGKQGSATLFAGWCRCGKWQSPLMGTASSVRALAMQEHFQQVGGGEFKGEE